MAAGTGLFNVEKNVRGPELKVNLDIVLLADGHSVPHTMSKHVRQIIGTICILLYILMKKEPGTSFAWNKLPQYIGYKGNVVKRELGEPVITNIMRYDCDQPFCSVAFCPSPEKASLH